jgi:GNAT superfamily N-acetyltransferase
MLIKTLKTPDEIILSFDAFVELRPHLTNKEAFASQILEQQKEGYRIVALEVHSEIVACIGFRFLTTLAWGKTLYIDDLITKAKARGKGYGKLLLDHVTQIARNHSCNEVHLDTGYARHTAHKVYLKHGFEFNCHHLMLKIK